MLLSQWLEGRGKIAPGNYVRSTSNYSACLPLHLPFYCGLQFAVELIQFSYIVCNSLVQ